MIKLNKGFTSIEFLLGLLLSMYLSLLLFNSVKLIQRTSLTSYNHDLLSAVQIHQILNASIDIDVQRESITFKYLNEERRLRFVNDKLVMSPGTVIYFLDVKDYYFKEDDEVIILYLRRNDRFRKYKVGIV